MKLVREYINEKFTEDSDPIHDMGIGKAGFIKRWLDKMKINNYVINDDFTIDVHGEVLLDGKLEGNLPDYIQFNIVDDCFAFNGCGVTSLKGSPYSIGRFFGCDHNNIESLEYMPKIIKTTCFLNNNGIKFTKKEIEAVCNVGRTIFTA
jgi:hypothetical protein